MNKNFSAKTFNHQKAFFQKLIIKEEV